MNRYISHSTGSLIYPMLLLLCILSASVFSIQAQAMPEIIVFEYDGEPLIYDEVEAGTASSVFTWEAINVTEPDRMQLHALVDGQWALIGENFEIAKSDTLVIAHPLSFRLPLYRLSIVNQNNTIVDEVRLQLRYTDNDPDGTPSIDAFNIDTDSVSRTALVSGTARIGVSWNIANRLPTTNIIFEQVLPEQTWVEIELPRFDNWMRASGSGQVAPIHLPNETTLTIQARLIDIITGETLQIVHRSVNIIEDVINTALTQEPNQTTTEIVTEPIQFVAPQLVTLGSRVTLEWNVPIGVYSAEEVVIKEWHLISFGGKYGNQPTYIDAEGDVPVNEWSNLPLNGRLIVDITNVFPASSHPWRETQNVVIYALYLNGVGLQSQAYADRAVYLRTAEQVTNCTPTMIAPNQILTGEPFTISWDTCGLPFVELNVDPDTDQTWYPYRPLYGDDALSTAINLTPEQESLMVTYTLLGMDGIEIISRTVTVMR